MESALGSKRLKGNVIKLRYYDRSPHQKGLFFKKNSNRIIYRFPAEFRNDKEYITRLVGLIQKNENEVNSGSYFKGATRYSLLNRDKVVVLVDRGTFFANNNKNY